MAYATDDGAVVTMSSTDSVRSYFALVVTVLVVTGGFVGFVGFVGVGPAAAAGNTLVVDPADPSAYDTVQAALDASSDGDTVEVRPGTYPEEVAISTAVTLTAPSGATLDGSSFGTDSVGIDIDPSLSSGLLVEGFTVEGYGDGISVGGTTGDASYGDTGETEIVGGWTIQDVTVRNNADDGLDVAAATGSAWTMTGVTAVDNGDEGIEIGGPGGSVAWTMDSVESSRNGDKGIFVSLSTGTWSILDSTTDDNDNAGVYITSRDSTWTIGRHTATGNGATGIDVAGSFSDAWTVHNSTLSNNQGSGIGNGGGIAGDWEIRDTVTESNYDFGVYVPNAPDDWRLRNVTVRDNSWGGISVQGTEGNWRIDDSTIENNGDYRGLDAIEAKYTEGAWAIDNTSIVGNANGGIDAEGGDYTGDATGNWWGQASGPTGTQCVGNVDCSSPLPSAPGTTPPTTATVAGTVTDASGTPLDGILVVVSRDDGTGSFVDLPGVGTDANGQYSAEVDVPSGQTNVDVRVRFVDADDVYASESYDEALDPNDATTVPVKAGTTVTVDEDLLVEDDVTGGFAGTVTTDAGDPLSGVEVTVFRDDGTGTFREWTTERTDANGEYDIAVRPVSQSDADVTAKLRFVDPSGLYATEWYESVGEAATQSDAEAVTAAVGSAQSNLDVSLGDASVATVAGTVTDEAGDPLDGILVVVSRDDGTGSFTDVGTTNTLSTGRYSFEADVPSGQSSVDLRVRFVDADDVYASESYDDALDPDDATTVTVPAGTTGTVDEDLLLEDDVTGRFLGTLTDESGAPVSGIDVTVFRDDGTGTFREWTTERTDANGEYDIAVRPVSQSDASVDAKLRFSDPDEEYATEWYKSGTVNARSGSDAEAVTAAVGNGLIDLDEELQDNVVTVGGIVDNAENERLEGISVRVYRDDGTGQFVLYSPATTTTDSSGRYTTEVAPLPGESTVRFRVKFSDPGDDYGRIFYRDALNPDNAEVLEYVSGTKLPNVPGTLSPRQDVSVRYLGSVYDGADQSTPLEDVRVTIFRDDGTGTFREWTNVRTDENGYWETDVYPPEGESEVAVKIRYRDETGKFVEEWEFDAPSEATADVKAASVGNSFLLYGTRLARDETATVSGAVTDRYGNRLSGIEVTLYRHDGVGASEPYATTTTRDVTGQYRFDVPAPYGESTVGTRLRFHDPSGEYAPMWYDDARRRANSTRLNTAVGDSSGGHFQTLFEAGLLLDVRVQALSTCPDPTDADSCTFADATDEVTVDPGEEVAIRYELWNGDDRTYPSYELTDSETGASLQNSGSGLPRGSIVGTEATLTAPIVDGTYDYEVDASGVNSLGETTTDNDWYTVKVTGSVVQTVKTDGQFDATVSNAGSGQSVLVDGGASGMSAAANTTFESLRLTTAGGDFTLSTTASDAAPAGTQRLATGSGPTLGYLTVDHSVPDSQIDGAVFRFRVNKSTLADASASPSDLRLYRYVGGSPTALSTTLVRETPTQYVFETDSPGLSVFAVGVRESRRGGGGGGGGGGSGGGDGGSSGGDDGSSSDIDDGTEDVEATSTATPASATTTAESPTSTPTVTASPTATAEPTSPAPPTTATRTETRSPGLGPLAALLALLLVAVAARRESRQ
ncbi:right-handed parallel beta-helix repeat-containing protein [Halogranum gelatinilyticum]|uniref:right-handed parallel beta-helix repeat-containing protein n=1 Tax=Halogranum gelatinilyticum TaxID=660521 RepID=UPI0011143F19|nr:right-handed parallel beta-helix repeat-containing protein [Halogranum gelatinilyticum]